MKPETSQTNARLGHDVHILCGDCTEEMEKIRSKAVQLVFTSPPYGIGKQYGKQKEQVGSLDDYLETMGPALAQIWRVLGPRGSLCWQVGNHVKDCEVFPLDTIYYPILKEIGFVLRGRIIWHYEHGLHAKKKFSGRYETILWFTKTHDYVFNLDDIRVPSKYPGKKHYKGPRKGQLSGNPHGKNPSDFWSEENLIQEEWKRLVWNVPNVKSNHPEKTSHPCQFPVELAQRCVLAFTDEGDWVLDPFAGVGSTMIAAVSLGRKAFMCELEAEYCNLAAKRLKDYRKGQLRLRPLGKPVHQPSASEKQSQRPKDWDLLAAQPEKEPPAPDPPSTEDTLGLAQTKICEQKNATITGFPVPSVGVNEAALILGCSTKQVHAYCNEKVLPFHKTGNSRRFRPEDFEEFWTKVGRNSLDRTSSDSLQQTSKRKTDEERRDARSCKGRGQESGSGDSRKLTTEEVRRLCLED